MFCAMKLGEESRSKTLAVLLLAVIACIIWLVSILVAYPEFQNSWLTEPLAMIHSLAPLYYVAILLMALAGLGCFAFRIGNRSVHLVLLMLFAAMLWATPYFLAGFSRHGHLPTMMGVSTHIPEFYENQWIIGSEYARTHPLLFVFNYALLTVSAVTPMAYMSLSPAFFTVLFIPLCYLFVANLFSDRVALLSLLLAIPGHNPMLAPMPSTMGYILTMAVMLMLTLPKLSVGLGVAAGIVLIGLVTAHPVSPLILVSFLAARVVADFLRQSNGYRRTTVKVLVLCVVAYLLFSLWSPESLNLAKWAIGIVQRMADFSQLATFRHQLFGRVFIYDNIYNLMRGVYLLYGTLVVVLLLRVLVNTYLQARDVRKWLTRRGGLSRSQLFLVLSVPLLLLVTVFLSEGTPGIGDLAGRSLTYLVLVSSCLIASVAVAAFAHDTRSKTYLKLLVGILVVILTLSSPLIAYRSEAAWNFAVSEEVGLRFIAENAELDGKTVAGGNAHQLAFFPEAAFTKPRFEHIGFPRPHKAGDLQTDISLFRRTDYYYAAMVRDLSFEENAFTRHLSTIAGSDGHNLVYVNQAFQVFLRR